MLAHGSIQPKPVHCKGGDHVEMYLVMQWRMHESGIRIKIYEHYALEKEPVQWKERKIFLQIKDQMQVLM